MITDLTNAMIHNKTLIKLQLQENSLTDTDAIHLVTTLPDIPKLEVLDLFRNNMNANHQFLRECLQRPSNIRTLRLDGFHFTTPHMRPDYETMLTFLERNVRLAYVNLEWEFPESSNVMAYRIRDVLLQNRFARPLFFQPKDSHQLSLSVWPQMIINSNAILRAEDGFVTESESRIHCNLIYYIVRNSVNMVWVHATTASLNKSTTE